MRKRGALRQITALGYSAFEDHSVREQNDSQLLSSSSLLAPKMDVMKEFSTLVVSNLRRGTHFLFLFHGKFEISESSGLRDSKLDRIYRWIGMS